MQIRSDYPGGNISVIDIGEKIIQLQQDLRDTTEWWFYWNFCAKGKMSSEYKFLFTNGEVLGPFGPAISYDRVTWQWLGKESLLGRTGFRYIFDSDREVYFSFAFPYQLADFYRFIQARDWQQRMTETVLCTTEKGRSLPVFSLGNMSAAEDIVLTARHHACEAPGSYLLEGLLAYLLSNEGSSILQKYRIHVIPFVDLDGVEDGDQGKSRAPHDHNRDYTDEPYYRVVAALMEYVKKLNLLIGIDLHAPYKWGGRNDCPFFVKRDSPIKEEIELLASFLKKITAQENAITYTGEYDVMPGSVDWAKPKMPTASGFFFKQGAQLCFTFEFPYFGLGQPLNSQGNMRKFGADFGQALAAYLATKADNSLKRSSLSLL